MGKIFLEDFHFVLDKQRKTSIIVFVRQDTAGLCKGSTADSDSVCEGSNPSPAAKKLCTYCGTEFFLDLRGPCVGAKNLTYREKTERQWKTTASQHSLSKSGQSGRKAYSAYHAFLWRRQRPAQQFLCVWNTAPDIGACIWRRQPAPHNLSRHDAGRFLHSFWNGCKAAL